MKKLLLALLLSICLVWTLPAALAEGTPYIPGKATSTLFSQACEAGDTLLVDLQLFLDFTDSITDDPDDLKLLNALTETLDHSTLTLGVCRLDDGLRLELAAAYDTADGPIDVSAALTLTGEGIALESNLIKGERITAKWETLLALCGFDDEEIAVIMAFTSLPAEQKLAALEPVAAVLMPYGQILTDFLASLPMALYEDVPAEGDYPAVAQELIIGCTGADISTLLETLAAQLDSDDTLTAVLDSLLVAFESDTGDLCAALRGIASDLADSEDSLTLFLGLDETGDFVFVSLYGENETGEEAFTIDLCIKPGSTKEAFYTWGNFLLLDEEQYYTDGIAFAVNRAPGEEHPDEISTLFATEVYMDGEIIASAQSESTTTAITTEDGLNGLTIDYAYSYSITDSENSLNMVMTMDGVLQQTADGGETQAVSGAMETYVDDIVIPITFDVTQQTQCTQDGPVSELSCGLSLPLEGLDLCGFRTRLYTRAFDADAVAALHELTLETISSDEMDALMVEAQTALTDRAEQLLQALPPEILNLILESL